MKIFLDCGYYVGKALEYYASFLDDSWTVYVFEPNERLNVKETTKRFPFKVKWIKKAVWVADEPLDFVLPPRNDSSHISSIRSSTDERVVVQGIDFSKFVAKLPKDAIIVCSMDIEGAEFPVLRKMLAEETVQRLSLLDIEFHHRLVPGEDEASASLLRRELEGEGVLVKLKLEL